MLHLFPQMANTVWEKSSEQAPCLGSSAVSVFTSSLGCGTGENPSSGLTWEREASLRQQPGASQEELKI